LAGLAAAMASRSTGENFPVALRLLPARHRRHLMAVYGFARMTDDIGDQAPVADRLRLLDELERDLGRAWSGEPRLPVLRALAPTVAECGLDAQPFVDLIEANRQDQVVASYPTFADLVGYCKLSANPVGRIVLQVFGAFSPARAELSDDICTALQLAEHWQDVAEDLTAGRVYLPVEDLETYRCSQADLERRPASSAVRELIEFETVRARGLLDRGAPLVGTLRGTARLAVAGYVAGGRAALAAITAAGHDVLSSTPRPARRRLAAELARALVTGR
jgi:squalene synthase HpnC